MSKAAEVKQTQIHERDSSLSSLERKYLLKNLFNTPMGGFKTLLWAELLPPTPEH